MCLIIMSWQKSLSRVFSSSGSPSPSPFNNAEGRESDGTNSEAASAVAESGPAGTVSVTDTSRSGSSAEPASPD